MPRRSRLARIALITGCLVSVWSLMPEGLASPMPDPSPRAVVRIASVPSDLHRGDLLTLDLSGSRLGPGQCVASVSVAWAPAVPSANSIRPALAWTDPVDRTGQRCDGTLPQPTIDVGVPEDFTGGTLLVKLTSFPKRARASSTATWVTGSTPVRVADQDPVAVLFAQASPASAGQPLILDARASWDPQGQPLQYAWDLNGDGSFTDDPGSAEPGIAVIPASDAAIRTQTEPRAMDPAQIAQGLTRMRACQPTSAAFVSMEVAPEVVGRPLVRAGMQRLWDMRVTWRDVNPERGRFDWGLLDQRVRQAEVAGAKVLLVLGMTPQWAAADPNAGDPRWGAGSASPPRDTEDWRAYVDAVVSRYGSRIAAYEVWNEASLKTFWTGTAHDMANLTAIAYRAIKAKQPDATVLAASVTTRLARPMELFMNQYLDSLGGHGYPFDGFAIHTYPAGNAGADARVADITNWQQVVVEKVGPDSPVLDKVVWDTEVNYGLAGPGPRPATAFTDAQGAELITRTFVDSHRLGIDATFWYMYTAQPFGLLGVQLWAGAPLARSAWTAVRGRFAAGTNPCPGGFGAGVSATPVAVRVLAPDGRASIAAIQATSTAAITADGTVQAAPQMYPPGTVIPLEISWPVTPTSTALVGCLDAIGAGRFDQVIAMASGQPSVRTSVLAGAPGRHPLAIAFWPADANPGCANATDTGPGLIQVARTSVAVGGQPPKAAVKGRLAFTGGKVVAPGSPDQAGALQQVVTRGDYAFTGPARSKLGGLKSTGRFAAQWSSAWATTARSGVGALATGYVLLDGGGQQCLRATISLDGMELTSVGGTGKAARTLLRIQSAAMVVERRGPAGRRFDVQPQQVRVLTAPGSGSPSMPAPCRALVRYLR